MQFYSLHCTPEQTEKAFNMGAPIEYHSMFLEDGGEHLMKLNGAIYVIPTQEQMVNWLSLSGMGAESLSLLGEYLIQEHSYNKACERYINWALSWLEHQYEKAKRPFQTPLKEK